MSGTPTIDPLEDRLRTELRHRAAAAPTAPTWDDIASTRVPPRRTPVLVAAAAFVLIAALGVVLAGRDAERTLGPAGDDRSSVPTGELWERGTAQLHAEALPDAGLGEREDVSGVWTGSRYIVWGGTADGRLFNDGAIYDPATATWARIPVAPVEGRRNAFAAWTGTELVVWGGQGSNPALWYADGAAFDPSRGAWRALPAMSEELAQRRPVALAVQRGRLVVGLGRPFLRVVRPDEPSAAVLDVGADTWRGIGTGAIDGAAVTGNHLVALVSRGPSSPDEGSLAVQVVPMDGGAPAALDRVPFDGTPDSAAIVGLGDHAAVVAQGIDGTGVVATYTPADDRFASVYAGKVDASASAMHTPGTYGTAPTIGVQGRVVIHGHRGVVEVDPLTGSRTAYAPDARQHCVGPNRATVWSGESWYSFGGGTTCGPDGRVGHAVRHVLEPIVPSEGFPWWTMRTIAGALALTTGLLALVGLARRRFAPDRFTPLPSRTRRGAKVVAAGAAIAFASSTLASAGALARFGPEPPDATGRAPAEVTVDAAVSEVAAPPLSNRTGMAGVWTGRELILWGGTVRRDANPERPLTPDEIYNAPPDQVTNDGAAFDPMAGTWRTLALSPLRARSNAVAVWTGTEVIVWGGHQGGNDGAAYNPATDFWRPIAAAPAGAAAVRGNAYEQALWVGGRMVVAGTIDGQEALFAYDPAGDRWTTLHEGENQAVAIDGRVVLYGDRGVVPGHGFLVIDPASGARRSLASRPGPHDGDDEHGQHGPFSLGTDGRHLLVGRYAEGAQWTDWLDLAADRWVLSRQADWSAAQPSPVGSVSAWGRDVKRFDPIGGRIERIAELRDPEPAGSCRWTSYDTPFHHAPTPAGILVWNITACHSDPAPRIYRVTLP